MLFFAKIQSYSDVKRTLCKKPQFCEVFSLTYEKTASTLHSLLISSMILTYKGKIVNKNDLIAAVATAAGFSKVDAAAAVDGVFSSITDALAAGGDVRLVGFGTFSVAQRAASEGRNPRTGEKIQIPASKQPKFKAGKGLKDAVNK